MEKFVLFILIIVSTNASLESCNKVLDDLIIKYLTGGQNLFIKTIYPYLRVSGKSPWAYGDYDACIRDSFLFSTVAVFGSPITPLHMGFCHSNQCTTEDLSNEDIQQRIKTIVKASHILDPYVDIDKLSYIVFEPDYLQNENRMQFVFTSILIIILLTLSLIDPIYSHIRQKQKQSIELNINQLQDAEGKDQPQSIFQDFSLLKNYEQLMNLKLIDPNLAIFDGLRAIAFFTVLFGHTYDVFSTAVSPFDVLRIQKEWIYILIGDALYSVDVFFWIGGFFIGFVLFERQKIGQLKNKPQGLLLILVHRFLRIWPCYIFAIFFHCYIGQKIGGGPRWFMTNKKFQSHTCWRNMLFIDNFYADQQYCFGWGWYLSNDMQMFISCLIPLIIYSFNKFYGKISILIMFIITLAISLYVSFKYEYTAPAIASQIQGQFYIYYIKPYCRAPPYFVGLYLGVQYREWKDSQKYGVNDASYNIITKLKSYANNSSQRKLFVQLFCYILGTGIILLFSLGWRGLQVSEDREKYGPQWLWYLWHGTCRPIFVVGVSLLVLPCMIGLSDYFNTKFMNCTFFRFIAKISFSCYLIHYTILTIIMASFYETPEYTFKSQLSVYIVSGCITIILASSITLLVEIPFMKLESRLLSKQKKSKSVQEQKLL